MCCFAGEATHRIAAGGIKNTDFTRKKTVTENNTRNRLLCIVFVLRKTLFVFFSDCRISEKERNAPQTGKADNSVDNSAQNSSLTAEYPCDKVELEKTDKSPVYRADNCQCERYFVKHKLQLLFAIIMSRSLCFYSSEFVSHYHASEKIDDLSEIIFFVKSNRLLVAHTGGEHKSL